MVAHASSGKCAQGRAGPSFRGGANRVLVGIEHLDCAAGTE